MQQDIQKTAHEEVSQQFVESLVISQATELARGGAYEQAEELIADMLLSEYATPQMLDLGARIAAQTGRYPRARELWERALTQAPGKTRYQAALSRLEAVQRAHLRNKKMRQWSVVVVCAALVGVLSWVTYRPRPQAAVVQASVIPAEPTRLAVVPTARPTVVLTPTASMQQPSLVELVEQQLASQPQLGTAIHAASRQDTILLYGSVPSAAAYQQALALVRLVPGVAEVNAKALVISAAHLAEVVSQLAPQYPGLVIEIQGADVRLGGNTSPTGLAAVIGALAQVEDIGYIDATAVTTQVVYEPYVVQPGDTLSSIARDLLGDAYAWYELAALNYSQVPNPDLIYPGLVLRIPR